MHCDLRGLEDIVLRETVSHRRMGTMDATDMRALEESPSRTQKAQQQHQGWEGAGELPAVTELQVHKTGRVLGWTVVMGTAVHVCVPGTGHWVRSELGTYECWDS